MPRVARPSGAPLDGPPPPAGPRPPGASEPRFRDVLQRGARAARTPGRAEPDEGLPPPVAPPPPYLRQEGPLALCRPPAPAARSADGDRLLVGAGPHGAEVRLRIGAGPLAGAEIQLRQAAGAVEAAILTAEGSSRQTLVMAMEEVARRLRLRGRVLVPRERAGGWAPGR